MATINVAPEYGWVVLAAGIGPVVTSMFLSGAVMSARSRLDVPYPNAYAVPGVHKHADEFNRVQRSHQNYLENIGGYTVMTLLGGLKYPIVCAGGSVLYFIGSYLYQKGYTDLKVDSSTARHTKGGPIKYIGLFASLYSCGALAYSLITSA